MGAGLAAAVTAEGTLRCRAHSLGTQSRALLGCSGSLEQAGSVGERKQSQEFRAIQSSAKPHALQRCGRKKGTELPLPQPSG